MNKLYFISRSDRLSRSERLTLIALSEAMGQIAGCFPELEERLKDAPWLDTVTVVVKTVRNAMANLESYESRLLQISDLVHPFVREFNSKEPNE